MTADTIAINQMMDQFDGHHSVWLFGYGSLIYKADFPYLQRRPASIANWTRRFWQGSHDHRGTPEAPGRVVTIIEEAGAICHGMAYLVTPEVFSHLDHREKNGYLRLATTITFDDGGKDSDGSDSDSDSNNDSVVGLVYIATPDNTAFLGEASEQEIARHIARSIGPSGPNSDYLNHLAHALRELGRHDQHVFEIERHLAALNNPPSTVPSE
jgi:cation transport regulator ChaC